MYNPLTPERFLTNSLRSSPAGAAISRVLAAPLLACDPTQAILRHVSYHGGCLHVKDQSYNLDQFNHIYIVGAGKAGFPMALATAQLIGDHLSGGIVIVKDGYLPDATCPYPITFVEAGHPVPNNQGLVATRAILRLLDNARENDLILCVISGGGSALLTAPTDKISLSEMAELTSHLLACGASIQKINVLRKHLEHIKGGRLSQRAWPASVIALILSDVVGDPLEAIASGPTAPDPSTYADSLQILEAYHLLERVSPTITDHLKRGLSGREPETPKPGDQVFNRTHNCLIGNNHQAIQAAQAQAEKEGYQVQILTEAMQGEASSIGRSIGAQIRDSLLDADPLSQPVCWLAGGETTVTLDYPGGLGGRNQELALAAAPYLSGIPGITLVTLATDGTDGPTDAAGAVVTGETIERAKSLALNPEIALQHHASYNFFDRLGDLLKPGATLTNVNDLLLIFRS